MDYVVLVDDMVYWNGDGNREAAQSKTNNVTTRLT